MKNKKILAASLSILTNIVLTLLKIVAGFISGSISIVSEALHSLSDFFASVVTFYSVKKSSEPADEDHPYGHGKYEDMAGFIEGVLILGVAVAIILKSVQKVLLSVPPEIDSNIAVIVMLFAAIINYFVSSYLFKVAKEYESISLHADGEHLRTDVLSSLGVFAGLLLIKVTGLSILDPIIAIIVATFIFNAGYKISKQSCMNLLDHSIPISDIKKIECIVADYGNTAILKKNSIRARQVGPTKAIELILQFPKDTTIYDCHKICDSIEAQIQSLFKNCSISIHSEPIIKEKEIYDFQKEDNKQKV